MALYVNGLVVTGGGGNANIWEGTQAEYDAIVNKDPDTVYFITDTNGDGSQFQPVVYSLDEREIGVWTDGKPLYQKTKYLSNYAITANTSQNIPLSVGNIEKVVSCNGTMSNSTKTTWRALPFYDVGAPDDSTFIWVDTSTDNVILRSKSNWTSSDILITVCYTKTTDTAGSGQWTPQGVPAVHYSTDEQVVGTWINGETVYEKVFTGTTDSNNTITLLTGVEHLVSYGGIAGRYTLPAVQLDNNRKYITVLWNTDTTVKLYTSGSDYGGHAYTITLRYTKSSS